MSPGSGSAMRADAARLCAAALLAALPLAAAADCAPGIADVRSGASEARFRVEIADDEGERAQGLMFRESLPAFGGMLFVYEAPREASFWMKNTLIPLDILFFDAEGRLLRVHENAVPGDLTPIPSGGEAQFVLEINGGAARRLGLLEDAELRHPAIDPDRAAWSCAAE
jgi:hypothetical protein